MPCPDPAHRVRPPLLALLSLVGPIAITATRGPELWASPWTWWGVTTGVVLGVTVVVPRRRAARRGR